MIDRTSPGPWREVTAWAALTSWFVATAVLGVSAAYRTVDLAWLALLWASWSLAIHQGALLLRRLAGSAGAWSGAFLLSLTTVWQLREQSLVPDGIPAAVLAAALATLPVFLVLVRPMPERPGRLRFTLVGLAVLSLGLAVVVGTRSSETFRWHLLRHNTLLGTPAYYLLEEPVRAVQERIYGSRRDVPPPVEEPTAPGPDSAGDRPNLVFVLLDTLRTDALAAWGGDPERMPRLNRRLENAVRFRDVWANASWTRPSMASFFTGLLPEEHGAVGVDDALAEGFVTAAESLSAAGYRTVAFTTNLAASGRGAGFAQGFDTFVELEGEPYARAERVQRAVEAWLARDEVEGPVFLYLHFLDPHEPYLSGEAPNRRGEAAYRRAYDEELRYLDRRLDETLEAVEAGLPGEEIFLVASDHGEELFEHELFGHGQSLYEEVVHVPVAVAGPGIGTATVESPLEARDFHDLLVGLGRGTIESPVAWARESARPRRYSSLYYSTTGRLLLRPYLRNVAMRALQEGDEKLIWSAYGETRELYDLSADPGETRNLVAERPQRAAELTAALDEPVRFRVERTPVQASETERNQLEALGYVD